MNFNLSIRRKLLGFSLLGFFFVVVVGVAGFVAVNRLTFATGHITNIGSALKEQMYADMMHDALRGDVLRALLAASKNDKADEKAIKEDLAEHSKGFRESMRKLDTLVTDASTTAAVAKMRPALDAYLTSAEAVIGLAFTDTSAADARLPAFQAAFDKLEKEMGDLDDLLEDRARTIQAESAGTSTGARVAIFASAAVAGATFLALGLLIGRSVVRPIGEAVKIAEAVASGDLTSQVQVTTSDETGQLMRSLQTMNASLARIVSTVRQGGENIATGSSQIAIGNADLSQRTETQASNLQAAAASMEQLSGTVRNNADTARQATELAHSASEVASKGGEVVGRVVSTMAEISQSSKKINDIIGVIDGIAFQTNILALNAAVEAARAGEQGRGFAVVAGEVRNLAQRSAEAAKEIKSLISTSVDRVEQGTELVDQAGSTMQEIVASIKRVSDIIGEISAASAEQSSGVAQVGNAVSQMDQATQQNAALVEQSAAAAESLKQQAQQLVQAVSVFKVDHGMSHAAKPFVTPVTPTATPSFGGQERRAGSRAPQFKAAAPKAIAAPRAEPYTPPPAIEAKSEPSKGASDDWETF
ncbi:MAG: HAMP domain-containing protein [Aquabacterium sp.]|nr:MAG: HAMP domain-containing protein [Aquabacterium sp.]